MSLEDGARLQAASEIMTVARRIHPASPEGFCLGVVVGQLLAQGFDAVEVRLLVADAVEASLKASLETAAPSAGAN